VLSASVLVLNRNYQPIQVTSVRRAFCLLFRGVAQAVGPDFRTFDFEAWSDLDPSSGEEVRTPRLRLRIPRVILLYAFDRLPPSVVRFSRSNVFTRDGHTCQYCGRKLPRHRLNIDHVIPRSQGGKSTWENVVCSCVTCNRKKGGRSPRQAGLRLLRTPRRPRWTPLFRLSAASPHEEWIPFLAALGEALRATR